VTHPMARVQPRNSPLSQPTQSPAAAKSSPPVGAYNVNVPRLFRYPPYDHREPSRCDCCCFLCWLISIIVFLAVILGAAGGIFYLIFRPEAPVYSIQRIAIKGVNLTSSVFSPEFDVTVRAYNGNNKIGIYYEKGSSVAVFYNDARLCDGVLPAFYQPSNNETVLKAVLKGNDVELTVTDQTTLVKGVSEQNVPLKLELRVPVKIRVGSVTTSKIGVRVECDVTVDELTTQARIVRWDCSYGLI